MKDGIKVKSSRKEIQQGFFSKEKNTVIVHTEEEEITGNSMGERSHFFSRYPPSSSCPYSS